MKNYKKSFRSSKFLKNFKLYFPNVPSYNKEHTFKNGCEFLKIEKINANQIRCTLTREDLESRDIKLSELAYGNAKARSLFSEMMKQAYQKYGFDVSGEPVMVEAVPVSSDALVLTITRVDSPEELDTRFARFSKYEKALLRKSNGDPDPGTSKSARDIMNLYKHMMDEMNRDLSEGEEEKVPENVILQSIYQFNRLEDLYRLSRVLGAPEGLDSALYKDDHGSRYFLLISQNSLSVESFNRINNRLSEYGSSISKIRLSAGYLKEHCRNLIPSHAIEELANLA